MISIVIPFLNEERALPPTLDAVFAAASVPCEVIAVDGGSTDASRAVLARYPRVRVMTAPARGRAQQMNAGAREATGDVLLFLHADTLLAPNALAAIERCARDPWRGWGGFHHVFSDADWRLAAISWLHNMRCRLTRAFYGDQAMFVHRDLFLAVGGFPEERLEDVRISERLLARARPTFLDLAVITDSRKFVQMGVWRSFGRVLAILACDRLGWPHPASFFADIR